MSSPRYHQGRSDRASHLGCLNPAKTARDKLMTELDAAHPGYGFAAHKGYGTKAHAEALTRLGPCPIHRMSFKPVKLAAQP